MATEVKTQLAEHPLMRAELKPEKKLKHRPRSHGNSRPQKELMIPGIVEFQLIQAALRTPKPPTPAAYRFGRLSHHSFFSRHHPHPQRVTHIKDLTGKPVCVVRDNFSLAPLPQATLLSRCLMGMPTISVPIGDPQSNRDPRLSYEAWKKELKNLASRVAVFTKESELKSKKKEEAQREQGAKYSAETGRLIPTSTQAIGRRHHSRQGPRIYPSGKDGGVETFTLQDQELLGGLILPGIRFSGPVGRGPRAGLQGLHIPPRAPAPADHSHSGPPSSSDTDLDLPLMTLDWRTQGKEGPEVVKMPEAQETAESEACTLLGGMEPYTGPPAESAGPGPEPALWDHPTSLLASPDPGNSRVGRPVWALKPPHQRFDPGAPLSNPADRFLERYPVLATARAPKGERFGPGAPADSGGAAPSSVPRLHTGRKTSGSAPGRTRAISREAAAALQPILEEDEDTASTQRRQTRVYWESPGPPNAFKPERNRGTVKAKGRMLRSARCSTCPVQEQPPGSRLLPTIPPQQQPRLCYHKEPIKNLPSL
ncbi:protein TBATA isoform X2 [Crocuta crocuta]